VTAQVGYNVDSFGHHAMLPQILKKSGLDYYVFMRPSPQEKGLPSRIFWWEADDGSRALNDALQSLTWCIHIPQGDDGDDFPAAMGPVVYGRVQAL
jgi:hypothetical protein